MEPRGGRLLCFMAGAIVHEVLATHADRYAVTAWLTAHLSIMFVPAAVGLIDEGEPLSRYGIGILAATAVSTLLTMVVTALVFRWAVTRFGPEDAGDKEGGEAMS